MSTPMDTSADSKQKNKEQRWEHEMIRDVLKITTEPQVAKVFGPDYVCLESLEDEGITQFNLDVVESLIVERLGAGFGSNNPFCYFVSAFGRAKNMKTKQINIKKETRMNKLNQMQDFCVSYAGIVAQSPDIIGDSSLLGKDFIVDAFLSSSQPPTSEFLQAFASRFRDEGLSSMMDPLFRELFSRMQNSNLLSDFLPLMKTLVQLTSISSIAVWIPKLWNWMPMIKNGSSMQQASFLGPFFSLSTFYEPSICEHFFGNPLERTRNDVDGTILSLRSQLSTIHDMQHKIILNLLKNKETRESMLEWIGAVIEGNKTRTRLRDDAFSSASEGFMTNFSFVMLKLCEPFLDVNSKKIKELDLDFVHSKKRMDLTEETKLAATSDEVAAWVDKRNHARTQQYKQQLGQTSSSSKSDSNKSVEDKNFPFITQIYFLTYRTLHIGLHVTIDRFEKLMRRLSDLNQQYREVQANPAHAEAEEIKDQFQRTVMMRLGSETQLLHPRLLSITGQFYRVAANWLLRIADPENRGAKYPLSEEVPEEFACLPEFFLEDISKFTIHLCRLSPGDLNPTSLDDMLTLIVHFSGNGSYVRNPYIRAKFPEVLSVLLENQNAESEGLGAPSVSSLLLNHKLAKKHLMSGLLQIYVDMEHTGSHTQFYDKFTPRFFISRVVEKLWYYQEYRQSFENLAADLENQKSANSVFMRFFNLLLNDANYLLDDSLTNLTEIHEIEVLMANKTEWNNLSQNEREEKEQTYSQLGNMVKSTMQLSRENVNMLAYLSRDFPEPFVSDIMVNRVAEMLNYFLVQLVGPKCRDLKVNNPDRYLFDPKFLLGKIVDSYIHFSKFEKFVTAVVSDERSYSDDVFRRAINLLHRKYLKSPQERTAFENFFEDAKAKSKEAMGDEEITEDAPDEFLDPIMSCIMKDPVILPSSRLVMERSVIERHLLSDATDPFNRTPLSADQLEPDAELRNKIESWFAEKRKSKNQ
eukprot:gb/GECH01004697.1/.p1 GENE.gb/GECH01004697.1/~~gb/GECH01004697.1/.p1  ORF type:complete len:978 (+),score=273.08 gb/GECH01004697.1/:1-2934(+)